MSAAEHVRRARRALVAVSIARAVVGGAVAAVLVVVLDAWLGGASRESSQVRLGGPMLGALAAAATASALLCRDRHVWSPARVALWIEERARELRWTLVTAIDPLTEPSARAGLERAVERTDLSAVRRQLTRRVAAWTAAALASVVAVGWGVPRVARIAESGRVAARTERGAPAAARSRLSPLVARLAPPAYAALAAQQLRDPASIEGLAGSRVTLTGPGEARGLSASLGGTALTVSDDRDGWRVAFALGDSAVVLRLADARASATRLVIAQGRRDAAPTARLVLPVRDTTVRSSAATFAIDAELTDDVGLDRARVEYIIASGEREGNFTFRQGTLGERALGGARSARLRSTLSLSALALQEGDQISVRVAAVDRNDVSGPGAGFSETRLIRVARKGEYDSLAVTAAAAPPPVAARLMTLQLLLLRTETLHVARGRLAPATYRRDAERLGDEGTEIEGRLAEVIDQQSEGGQLAVDARLLRAADALRDGTRALLGARTGEALPHLRAAVVSLEAYRVASRYYIRGRAPETLVNVERVRMAGRDTGHAAPRTPRERVSGRERVRAAWTDAVRQLQTAPARAIEGLTVARALALNDDPALAAALGDAIERIRAGNDPSAALLRARRLIDGPARATDALPAWSVPW